MSKEQLHLETKPTRNNLLLMINLTAAKKIPSPLYVKFQDTSFSKNNLYESLFYPGRQQKPVQVKASGAGVLTA